MKSLQARTSREQAACVLTALRRIREYRHRTETEPAKYRGADKSLARPGRKHATATKL